MPATSDEVLPVVIHCPPFTVLLCTRAICTLTYSYFANTRVSQKEKTNRRGVLVDVYWVAYF